MFMFGIINNQQFLEELGVANQPPEVKQQLAEKLEKLAQSKLTVKLSEKLTDEQAEAFGAITDEKASAEWLRQNVPDFLFLVGDVMEEMKREIMERKSQVVGA
jgi:hypothetical protein